MGGTTTIDAATCPVGLSRGDCFHSRMENPEHDRVQDSSPTTRVVCVTGQRERRGLLLRGLLRDPVVLQDIANLLISLLTSRSLPGPPQSMQQHAA